MTEELSLLEHCRRCGFRCCSGESGNPRICQEEERQINEADGEGKLILEHGYWVPKKEKGSCIFLNDGLCSLQHVKPIDCGIYPLDPVLDSDGNVNWVIDEECPAALDLPADFYAKAIVIGLDWIKKFDKAAFDDYWKKYKEGNPEQKIVHLGIILGMKDSPFLKGVREKIEELVGIGLESWLAQNNVVGLYKLVEA
jgi:Fe-S-cluster containining protein